MICTPKVRQKTFGVQIILRRPIASILVICVLFLGLMVSHREYVNLYYVIMHGVNNSMFCIDSS